MSRKRYTEAQRHEALAEARRTLAGGGTIAEAARRVGVVPHTLYAWREKAHGVRRRRREKLVEVSVIDKAEAASGARPVVVVGAARVEGLDLAGVVELLRRLA
jgi:transposase-like protein